MGEYKDNKKYMGQNKFDFKDEYNIKKVKPLFLLGD